MTHFIVYIFGTILLFCSHSLAQLEQLQGLESFHYCQYDSDCKENSFCFGNDGINAGKCKCKEEHVLVDRNRTYYECLLVAEGINSPCSKDVQCRVNLGSSGVCSEYAKVCKCGEGSSYGNDNRCHKSVALGELCTSNFNCLLDDGLYGYCDVGRCACMIQHRPSEDGRRCIPVVPLGKSCLDTEGCINDFAKCYGGICKCVAGFVEDSNNTECLTAANQVGDKCVESAQCSAYITGSFCANGTCACKSAHHGYGTECVPDAKLGDRCTHDKQCILSAEYEHSVRCTGVCTCVEGVTDTNSYGCTFTNASSKHFTPIIFLILVFSCVFYR